MWKKTEDLSDEGEEPLKPGTEAVGEITIYQYPQIETGCLSRKVLIRGVIQFSQNNQRP